MDRNELLTQWARYLSDAARGGALTGHPCAVTKIETISGPRAGALEIFAGLDSARLYRALSRADCAALRQFVPWHFQGAPQVFMSGRYLRVEAGWPSELAESLIRLGDLGAHPKNGGRWLAGKSETGAVISPGLTDLTPHFLLSGMTGSGKSVALRSAILQLSADPENSIVLADGKWGESLKLVEHLPGVLGPCATDGPQIRDCLGWSVAEMRRRYAAGYHDGRLIVCFDEFQEHAGDGVISDLLRKLAAQGRAAGVHLLAATQHPTVEAFGDTSTRRNLAGKVALRVSDPDASRVAVGAATPRADFLLGAGDSYTVAPGACHRVQLCYVDMREIAGGETGQAWRFTRWPDYDAEENGQDLPANQFVYDGRELGCAIVSAAEGEGRTLFTRRMDDAGLGTPGYNRQRRLRELGRDALDWMYSAGYSVFRRGTKRANYSEVLDIW